MNLSHHSPLPWMLTSLVFALGFMLYPLPAIFSYLRPESLVLWLLYWMLRFPYQLGIGSAWILGLGMDVLQGSVLGEHALALLLLAYILVRGHHRIVLFPRTQQVLCVFTLLLCYQSIIFWVQGTMGLLQGGVWQGFGSVVTTTLFWPCCWCLRHSFLSTKIMGTI